MVIELRNKNWYRNIWLLLVIFYQHYTYVAISSLKQIYNIATAAIAEAAMSLRETNNYEPIKRLSAQQLIRPDELTRY